MGIKKGYSHKTPGAGKRRVLRHSNGWWWAGVTRLKHSPSKNNPDVSFAYDVVGLSFASRPKDESAQTVARAATLRKGRSNFYVILTPTNQPQRSPCDVSRLAGWPLEQ